MTFKRNNLSQDVIHALTLTLVLCLTLLSGCSDKEEILPPEPEEGTDIVSEYKAYVGHPFNASLGEQTNGYTIKNNDPEKLKRNISESNISVSYVSFHFAKENHLYMCWTRITNW